MNWIEMFREETLTLLTHEDDVVPTLERIRTHADGAYVHEFLMRMIETAPSRQARLEVVCSFAGWSVERRPAHVLEAWARDVDALLDHHPKGPVVDATILMLVLKITRLRTTGYETAYLLAENLGAHHLAHLLRPIWDEDRAADERASATLATLIGSGGDDWDAAFRLSGDA